MALLLDTLKYELKKLMDKDHPDFVGFPSDYVGAASNFASAYDVYASQATDASGESVLTVNKPGFSSALTAKLNSPEGSADLASGAFDDAFVAYWTGATFVVGIPPPPVPTPPICPNVGGTGIFSIEASSVVSAVGVGTLKSLLFPIFTTFTEDGSARADDIAEALHTATTTAVTVLITGVDTTAPTPVPITNTCTVF